MWIVWWMLYWQRKRVKILVSWGLLSVVSPSFAECKTTTPALDTMEKVVIEFVSNDDKKLSMEVLVADDVDERAAGFQHICEETIDKTLIYFIFDRLRRPSFHMRNVYAPLDIAFISSDGSILEVQRMQPYVLGALKEKYYSPNMPVGSALEARAGFFSDHGIDSSWRIRIDTP